MGNNQSQQSIKKNNLFEVVNNIATNYILTQNFKDMQNLVSDLEYCDNLGGNVEYLQFCNAYHIVDSKILDRTEIYSLMTKSKLDETDYINTQYDTGHELTQKTE